MEKIRVDEVSKIISDRIKNFDQKVELEDTGGLAVAAKVGGGDAAG